MANTPILFTAREVVTAALMDLSVISESSTASAFEMQQGLSYLNRLVMQLRLQEFTFPFVGRQVFPVTSLQNTYTIGPGGDLDTQRPQSVEGCGLLLTPTTGSFAVTGVSVTARTFTVAGDQTGTFLSGSDFNVTGSTGNDGSYTIITSVFSSSTTVTVSEQPSSSVADGTIAVLADANATTEIPVPLLTDNAYQMIRVKGMQNTQFVQAYYNPTYAGGLGLLWLWPKPTIATNAIVLYLDQYIDTFADLSTQYSFPPGYFDLFEYGLARRLLVPYGIRGDDMTGEIRNQFALAASLVKRQNIKRNDMPQDTGMLGGATGVYNILTDSR